MNPRSEHTSKDGVMHLFQNYLGPPKSIGLPEFNFSILIVLEIKTVMF
jgi:hypothetical protein